jgi:hypothetical protein
MQINFSAPPACAKPENPVFKVNFLQKKQKLARGEFFLLVSHSQIAPV